MRAAVDSLELPAEQDAQLWGYLEMAAHSMQNR
jgi:hemoglobin